MPDFTLIGAYGTFLASYIVFALGKFLGMKIERARKEATITFGDYFRVGLPITVVTLALGYGWLSWVK